MLQIIELNLTTVCYPNSSHGLHCQCESGFAWPCEMCNINTSCSSQICTCIYGLPSVNDFCQPITNDSICPTPTPVTTTTTPMPTTTPTTTYEPLFFDVDIVLSIPAATVPLNIPESFRSALQTINYPIPISRINVLQVNLTTVCIPNSYDKLQCECEGGYALPCDMCNSNNSCSNTSSSTCTCINGLPPNDEFCQPETNNSICPTPTPVTTTTAAPTTTTATAAPTTTMATPTTTTLSPTTTPVATTTTTTTTAAPTTTTTAPTITTASTTITFPQQRGVTFVLKIPAYFIQNYTLQIFRSRVDEVFNSITLPPSLKVKEINLTTVCFKGISKELRCQCEDNFAWPCERCNSSRYSCSNVSSDYCTCRDGISSINEYCQPLLNNSRCPATPTTPLPTTTTAKPTTTSTMPNTTTAKPTTTSAMPVISTASPTTARPIPPNPPTAKPQVIRGRITIDIPFEPSFNTESSPFYQGIYDTITSQCGECSATLRLSPGSTIADYNITFTPPDTLTQEQILRQMSLKYPVLINGGNKEQRAYSGDPLTLTCEPPSIDFSAVTVFWRNKGKVIAEQSTLTNGKSEYKFPRIFKFDEGEYECEIKWGNASRFIQKVTLKSITLPDIDADPDRERLRCIDTKTLSCRVNSGFTVKLLNSEDQEIPMPHTYQPQENCVEGEVKYKCEARSVKYESLPPKSKEITLQLTEAVSFYCESTIYGNAQLGEIGTADCDEDERGEKTAVCGEDTTFGDEQDNCVLAVIADLLDQSENLDEVTIPIFLEDLKNATSANNEKIVESPATIIAMVKIFENVANVSSSLKIKISDNSTRNFLESAGLLTIDDSRKSWTFLNMNDTRNTTDEGLGRNSSSSSFLNVFERLPDFISNDSLEINTNFILLNKTELTDPFRREYNSSVEIELPEGGGENKLITIIVFASMYNVLPGRDELNNTSNRVHGRVALVRPEVKISNITLNFEVINYTNETIENPKCVFWDFDLFDGLGGWSDDGCSLVYFENETVSCNCNHTTSFSILMSPYSPRDLGLDIITYIGVGISMLCLVICLIIEAIIWRKVNKNTTSYLRHVAIVNIALSLLIANIWFIIGAAISDVTKSNNPACTAATFFIHFFYLSMFFWMLAKGLLLLYRTLSVFDGGLSKISMLIIGFSLGYGAPLIIATITIAATAPSKEYIRDEIICWLNWDESKALLAFVIPALMIVCINLIILIVVLYKILRRRVGGNAAQTGEKHVLVVVTRCLAVLTPFFGITWGLGIGTMADPKNKGIHIAFAFFNSLQGFFILVFGTLWDSKVRSAMAVPSLTSNSRTRSTSAGTSSSGLTNFFQRFKRGSRRGYNVSSNSSSNT